MIQAHQSLALAIFFQKFQFPIRPPPLAFGAVSLHAPSPHPDTLQRACTPRWRVTTVGSVYFVTFFSKCLVLISPFLPQGGSKRHAAAETADMEQSRLLAIVFAIEVLPMMVAQMKDKKTFKSFTVGMFTK